jgi:NAD(P)-dependent dehydrogenase (short-subunit alcohol dehydrogenase family)
MDKKVIFITGASGGMGQALTKWFSTNETIQLVLHANDNTDLLHASENSILVKGDLSSEEGCDEVKKQVLSKVNRIDVLINNAGISKSAMSWKQNSEDWKYTMAINLDAPFFLSKAFLPAMRANGFGRIINITSVVAQTGAIGTAAYSASKAGLIGLTKTIAKEVAVNGITVNALALGYFETGMIADVPDERLQQIVSTIPMGRLGSTQTVCSAIDWLITEEAGYITGQVINLNGGMY